MVQLRDYDQHAPELYDTRYAGKPVERYDHEHWYPLIAAAISRYCQDKAVLDVGCGTGVYTEIAARYACQTWGTDISQKMLDYAQKTRRGNINWTLADANHLFFEDGTMDAVICVGLLEYVERAPVIKEIRRVLKPGGAWIISSPNKHSAYRMMLKAGAWILRKNYPCREPSCGEITRLLKEHHFEVIESKMDDGLVWLPAFLDRLIGRAVYRSVELLFRVFGRNPFSNGMFFIARKIVSDQL